MFKKFFLSIFVLQFSLSTYAYQNTCGSKMFLVGMAGGACGIVATTVSGIVYGVCGVIPQCDSNTQELVYVEEPYSCNDCSGPQNTDCVPSTCYQNVPYCRQNSTENDPSPTPSLTPAVYVHGPCYTPSYISLMISIGVTSAFVLTTVVGFMMDFCSAVRM